MRKNILALLPSSSMGGAERLILEQIKFYTKKKFNLNVITLRKGDLEESFQQVAKERKVNYLCLKSKRICIIKNLKFLLRYIKDKKIDILHTNLVEADFYGFLIKTFNNKMKWVITKHATDDFRKRFWLGLPDGFISKRAEVIITVSKSVREFFHKYEKIPLDKMKVVYNGIDIKKFNKKGKEARKELNLNPKDFCIGIAGRISKEKGHEFLIKAVSELNKKIPFLKLVIIGTGALENKMKKLAKSLRVEKNVAFLGFRKDIEDLLPGFDLFVLPSLFEGFGLAVIEAMAADVPVIASRVGGLKEIIEDKRNGLFIQPNSVDDIYDKILWAYEHPKELKKLKKEAKKDVLKYDIQNNTKILESIYSKLK